MIIAALISWHLWSTCYSFTFTVISGLNGFPAEAIGVMESVGMDSKTAFGESISSQCICPLYPRFSGGLISHYCLISFLTCEMHWDSEEVLWGLFSEWDIVISMQHA